ncbi:MAG: DUF2163 domain-containing protein [Rickettsiales bacterium]|jgi:uncharacterized phage protein (TIGR02218 family)|nr:DUF2163 domain-containing protein [Rickettsiales bacterium]
MKILGSSTLELLDNNNFNFVKCFKITLKNHEVLTYTENSEDLIVDNLVYRSCDGIDLKTINQYGDATENSVNIVGFVNDGNINERDIVMGKFDDAKIDIFLVNKNVLDGEKIYLSKGYFKDIQLIDDKFFINIEGILTALKKPITENYSPLCRASFCDVRCKLNEENHSFVGSVDGVNSKISFFSNDLVDFEKNYFKYGIVTFMEGEDTRERIMIRENNQGTIILSNGLGRDIIVGDGFKIMAGCDKTIETCAKKFNNNINFRGEPNIPRTKIYQFY